MPRRTSYTYAAVALLLVIAALGLAAWLVSSLNELHERFARESRALGLAFLVVLIILLAIGAIWLGRLAWRSRSASAAAATAGPGRRDQGGGRPGGPGRRGDPPASATRRSRRS